MIKRTMAYCVRRGTKLITFPKLSPRKFNNLWNMSQNYFMNIEWGEIISIIKIILNRHGVSALIAIPSIFLLVKNSKILSDNESKDYTKMFKALTSEDIKFDKIILSNLTFTVFF